ncbi:MAG: transposase [Lachnospiraceae bacterium]|nr:transposase [Lachnospiraceae bacterium]
MAEEKICKTIHQYNKEPISSQDMEKLQEIADDYNKVKNYVFSRFGGIKSLPKLYPGYTIQNEMIASGYRDELALPFVYFNLAVFDALGSIKSQWTTIKAEVLQRVNANEGFTDEEKHYLRFVLKVSNAFEMVLNRREVRLDKAMQKQYDELCAKVSVPKLNNYLNRQVRKRHVQMHSEEANGFALTERAYRYANHGIYITMKEKRKRVFIPLTDNNSYNRQMYMKLYPEQRSIELHVPLYVEVKKHTDYTSEVGLAVGIHTMLVTDTGHSYGEKLGEYQIELSEWVREQRARYMANIHTNPGRKKYEAKKRRMTQQLHSYINMELNRFIKEEKPKVIYIPKLPKPRKHGGDKAVNHTVSMWQRGYIKSRLRQKCAEQSIELVEVFGKDISNECSKCGAIGKKKEDIFYCSVCGYQIEQKQNAAQNAKKRGLVQRSQQNR